ncbi:MAG: hypothetical protein K9K65_10065 [Desulfarculaceae bacterium]|nr:hypothetical protein [Desulfarculaceae bacterium]MCF8098175.1 hypothetical protein [Desulfarculaceae bacterium]MCF8121971.1 hypothetical protein [Desulfarculaceae bacterium]
MTSSSAGAQTAQAAKAQSRLALSKSKDRWVVSDPASPQAVCAALEEADNWQQGKKLLQEIFTRLLSS